MSDKNLIIGAATGFNKYDLFNFIESLRKVYFEDVILIMNNKIDSETNHYLNLNKISIFFTRSTSRTIFKDRYKIYLDIINNHNNAKNIMVSDTRDVIFLENPFENILFSKINFFLEDKSINLCRTNSRWINRSYGKKIYDQIKNNKISCSGVTLGEREEMIKYCNHMVQEIKQFKYYSLNPFNKGSDQGNHNNIVHSNRYSSVKKFVNDDCFVVNLSNTNPKTIQFENNNFYINQKKISVLHQYNSHSKVDDQVKKYIQHITK
ncbi:hypothetical protein [Candidatus Pelagibacter bacterium nBUS_32]|uniref:hypothetical protein n=1 Tax=Candidatus Pelagibacter bacterium nBUS_32 TaxID=3374192 RepID=UPI003EBA50C4